MLRVAYLEPTAGDAAIQLSDRLDLRSFAAVELLRAEIDSSGPPDLVLVGASVENPLETAAVARRLAPDTSVFILSTQERLAALRDAIRFSPFAGSHVECHAVEDLSGLAPRLIDGAERAHQRRRHRDWMRQASSAGVVRRVEFPLTPRRALDDSLERSPIGIQIVTATGVLVASNRRASEILGVPGRHLAGQTLAQVYPPATAERIAALVEEAARGDATIEDTVACAPPGRTEQQLDLTLSMLHDAHREPVVMLIVQDATERVAALAGLRQLNDTLNAEMEELQRSNAELRGFASEASHDLREPLRTIVGHLRLLERRYAARLGEDGQEYLGLALDAARRMHHLADDILEYGRLARATLVKQPVALEDLMRKVLHDLSGLIQEHHADVVCDELPVLPADETMLARVFQNLVANAIKFAGDRSPTVRVSARREEGAWRVSVADNGIGIPAAQLAAVFLPFRKLHPSSQYAGTGLGLSICERIVRRHGGSIWAESPAGGGTEIVFTLPATPDS